MTKLAPARPAWTVAAHTLAAAALGGLEAARLGGSLARATVPVLALTGLALGCAIAAAEAAAARLAGWRALAVAALPWLAIAIALAGELAGLAEGAPLAGALRWLGPLIAWPVIAAAIAGGRWLARDRMGRSIAILALAGALGAMVWIARHALVLGGTGHVAATLATLALAGAALRVGYRGRAPALAAVAIAALTLGTGSAVLHHGLAGVAADPRLWGQGALSCDAVVLWARLTGAA